MSINLLNCPEKMKEINNCIYIYTDIRNGMQYIGQAKNLYIRNGQHARRSGNTMFDNIYSAHKEYFTLSIIEKFDECTNVCDVLNNTEIYYIAALNTKYPNGYNLTDGGGGSRGRECTEETKKKISEKNKGKIITEEHKQKCREWNEQYWTEEMRQSQSKRISEIYWADEKRHENNKKNQPRRKSVRCIELDITFISCREAARWLRENGWPKAQHRYISEASKNQNKTAYGYHWEFIED